MTIVVKKAGELAAKEALKSSIKVPRAISQIEAPTIHPPRESSKSTLMPWKNWFQRWFRDQFGEERYQQLRNTFFFMPDDIYDLHQSPMPNKKIPISATDPSITHMYRYPAPGSQGPVKIPEFDENEDPYDTAYYKRDTRRRYLVTGVGDRELEKLKLALMDPNDPSVQEEKAKLEAGPISSPGNKGRFATGPSDFDPTGLRATMSSNWAALEASLDAHMPNHLPTPVWAGKEEEIMQWHSERNLPVPVGGYYEELKVPTHKRVAEW